MSELMLTGDDLRKLESNASALLEEIRGTLDYPEYPPDEMVIKDLALRIFEIAFKSEMEVGDNMQLYILEDWRQNG